MTEFDLIVETMERLGHTQPFAKYRQFEPIIRAAVELVERHAGAPLVTVSYAHVDPCPVELTLLRPAASITTVAERRRPEDEPVTLDASEYRLTSPWRLARLPGTPGGRPTWGAEVTVSYVPVIDQDLRDRTIIDLAVLSATYMPHDFKQLGDALQFRAPDYAERRDELLSRLSEGRAPVF